MGRRPSSNPQYSKGKKKNRFVSSSNFCLLKKTFLVPTTNRANGPCGLELLKKMPIQRAGDHLAFLQAIFVFFVLTPIKLLFFLLSSTPNCVYQQVLKFLFKFIGRSRAKKKGMKWSA